MLHGIGVASSIRIASTAPTTLRASQLHARDSKFFKHYNLLHNPHHPSKNRFIYCRSSSSWEPASPTNETTTIVAQPTTNIFETLTSETMAESKTSEPTETMNQSSSTVQDLFLKLPMWVLGPLVLLTTGMIPTLWLPISSIFLGPNITSLLSLVGLDCIFNLGATLFLLMADSCARPSNLRKPCNSKAPFSYQFWNLLASVTGFVVPTLMFLGSQRGLFQPQLPSIGFLVLLGPYFLLLSVQMLTEMLTWHWQSPVWLVTPVVYEAYRVLQLMRGLKLGAEMTAPAWVMNTIRVLVCWWVLILGVQLMRVAWFAGFSARKQEEETASIDGLAQSTAVSSD